MRGASDFMADHPSYVEERARQAAQAHERLVRRIFRAEQRLLNGATAATPRSIDKPKGAEAILARLAAAYPPGAQISISQVVRAAGCSQTIACQVRVWARSRGRWPYSDGKGARP